MDKNSTSKRGLTA